MGVISVKRGSNGLVKSISLNQFLYCLSNLDTVAHSGVVEHECAYTNSSMLVKTGEQNVFGTS